MPHIQVRQIDIQSIYPADEFCHAGDNLFFLQLLEIMPIFPDEIGQCTAGQFFGDDKGISFDAAFCFFAEADRFVRFDAVIEKQPGVFPLALPLRAKSAETAPGEEHILEVRVEKTLHEKLLLLRITSKTECHYAAFVVYAYRFYGRIFEEIAENEKYHAMEELKLLMGDRDTLTNLKESISGEQYEFEDMYPKYAIEAEVEGNRAATILFKQISKIEMQHHERFKKLLEMVEEGKVFKRDAPIKWKCSICGYIVEGTEPPPKCPSCQNPQEYYEPANMDV